MKGRGREFFTYYECAKDDHPLNQREGRFRLTGLQGFPILYTPRREQDE
jgi:hypothetical protein